MKRQTLDSTPQLDRTILTRCKNPCAIIIGLDDLQSAESFRVLKCLITLLNSPSQWPCNRAVLKLNRFRFPSLSWTSSTPAAITTSYYSPPWPAPPSFSSTWRLPAFPIPRISNTNIPGKGQNVFHGCTMFTLSVAFLLVGWGYPGCTTEGRIYSPPRQN